MQIPISNRYAVMAFDLCKQNDWLDKVYEDFESLQHFFEISEDFNDFITNPAFTHLKRVEVIQKLLHKHISDVTLRILLFIEEKKHLDLLDEIISDFLELYRKEKNILKVKIVSSTYLNQGQITKICEQLHHRFKKKMEYDLVIDPALIGGLKIFVGDMVYDFCFKSQLNRFRERILTPV